MAHRAGRLWAVTAALGVGLLAASLHAGEDLARFVGEEALGKIRAAAPEKPRTQPAKPRKLLVFTGAAARV